MDDLRDKLSHVLWIGGGTDAGKTSVADTLGANYRIPVYHYDRADLRHHQRLASTSSQHAAFLDRSMDERWVHPSPKELAQRSWQSFQDRFPLVIDDLTALQFPQDMYVLAEGFGLTPELVAPCLRHPQQAIWLVPTNAFKQASMERREKGKFGGQVSDPATAAANLLERDHLLTDWIRTSAKDIGFTVIEVDGSEAVEAMAARVSDHFGSLAEQLSRKS